MTRKISFDYDQALATATDLFWQSGYAATGLRHLLKAMDIGEGSFYNTLGSKKQLYLACLERYEHEVVDERIQVLLAAPSAAAGIRGFFDRVLARLDDPATPSRMCMLAAMQSAEVLADAELRERAERGLTDLQALIRERLREDIERGLLPGTLDADASASLIVTYLQGLWRTALVTFERSAAQRQIDVLLTALGL
ncbi:TetR/AcrR family transcriptional regulator [Pseudomonas maumuensis]|uniref:TetR/AcrR family transcriptional regulator n=1 Tax=Pseudomonas maumuensis TaxID=2842354 RepID=A0ABX8NIU2_9PSED|nr:TetR/AcrR family transcriptional regulator [Pseudomonas maumuensis]QXH56093.1 TetR/AcrR family transcriptional regulator [Pseudomonas maumuensis]